MGRLIGTRWRRAALVAALGTGTLLGACRGERVESVAYEGPFAETVREAIPKIEEAAGLPFLRPPRVEARSSAEVRAFLERRFEEQGTARDLAGQVAAYKRFGFLAETLDARAMLLDLLTEQIAGFYDPETDVLYVVEDGPAEMRETVIQHELVHALQDQYIALDSVQRLSGDNDLASAVQAVIEGQAVYEQLQAALNTRDVAAMLPGGWERLRTAIRQEQTNMPAFSAAPMVIQETLIFPYLTGAEFVRRVKQDTIPVPRITLPSSTEQVLHAEAYGATPDAPTRVELPPPSLGTAVYDNNLGEFETRLLLYQWSRDQALAARGAAGWDGDRYVVFDTPEGQAIAWLTVWDNGVESAEFYDAVDQALRRRFRDLRAENTTPQERRYTGGDRALRVTASEVEGRPVVLFVDVPRGGRTDDIIDLARVRLTEKPPLVTPVPVDAAGAPTAPGR